MTIDSRQTLDAALRRRAAELPDHVVYRYLQDGETESHQLTYAGLDARARARQGGKAWRWPYHRRRSG